jgi:hypothetical protein
MNYNTNKKYPNKIKKLVNVSLRDRSSKIISDILNSLSFVKWDSYIGDVEGRFQAYGWIEPIKKEQPMDFISIDFWVGDLTRWLSSCPPSRQLKIANILKEKGLEDPPPKFFTIKEGLPNIKNVVEKQIRGLKSKEKT